MEPKVWIVGAGPGAPDLLTLRAVEVLRTADVVVYTDSLIDERVLALVRPGAQILGSASLTLEEIIEALARPAYEGKRVVRLHSGDPSIFGAILEQLRGLKARGISFEIVPGVTAACAAAAALGIELTVPEVSQAVILARAGARTPLPPGQEVKALASHDATLVLYLSAALLEEVARDCIAGGYPPDTPSAVVYRASWPDEKVVRARLAQLASAARAQGIRSQAVVFVGKALGQQVWETGYRSRLYSPGFSHGYRQGDDSLPNSHEPNVRLPAPGEIVGCELDGRHVALLWHEGRLMAVQRWCPHRGGDLSKGFVLGNSLVCGDHGWAFSLEDGRAVSGNSDAKADVFDVVNEGGQWKLRKR